MNERGIITNIEERLQELNIQLPNLPANNQPFNAGVILGNTVILSGQTPKVDGSQKYTGIVGTSEVSMEEAQDAAEICTLNLLAALKDIIGDLNKVTRIIKMNGYVASTSDFKEHSKVINAASNLLNDIFGEENKHARVAVGMSSLPGGAPVEIEMIAEFE
ncbi:RidA family protein [Bacillus aerolatus]|uniref:RidA family protein n=2 Tax=Bacillus aerolatus TaxID=2653354 RepID=A0A6I1FDQ9_9BACI|nr:RidA family protein [Bacillus aerolatus]